MHFIRPFAFVSKSLQAARICSLLSASRRSTEVGGATSVDLTSEAERSWVVRAEGRVGSTRALLGGWGGRRVLKINDTNVLWQICS